MTCREILAGRDARVASDQMARDAWYAIHPNKTAPHPWHEGVDPTTGQTSEENACEAYEKSCRVDAGGTWNPDTDVCENYTPWNIDPTGTIKTVYVGEVGNPTIPEVVAPVITNGGQTDPSFTPGIVENGGQTTPSFSVGLGLVLLAGIAGYFIWRSL